MKKLCIYTILAALLAACSSDGPDPADNFDQYEMYFRATTAGLSRTDPDGVYNKETYPVDNLYLTAFLTDQTNYRQYYFTDTLLTYDSENSRWSLPGWYWPLQGKMSFLSYWSPGFSGPPVFDRLYDADGNAMPRMTVDATALDGKTDFIYLSQDVECPEIGTTTLRYLHGLSWITVTLKAEVLDAGGTSVDPTMTATLCDNLYIEKISIEDCARKGLATVVPGIGSTSLASTEIDINWKTYDDRDPDNVVNYCRDQVYYVNGATPGDITSYTWTEWPNADETPTTSSFKLTSTAQPLGVYGENEATSTYRHEGLLIVPQSQTSITIYYTVTNGSKVNHKVERYMLRDNDESWLPGYHYNYDIIFRSYDSFEVVPSWSGVTLGFGNYCYFGFGQLSATSTTIYSGFVIEPIHDGGSAMGDEMDYHEGERVY